MRGAFDAHARVLALLAVVAPLMTTLVAFYFGEKAGASDERDKVNTALQQTLDDPAIATQDDFVASVRAYLSRR